MFSMKSNKKEKPFMAFHNENENQKKNFSIFMYHITVCMYAKFV